MASRAHFSRGIGLIYAILLFVGLLELLAAFFGLPHVNKILFALWDMLQSGELTHDVLVSVARCVIGWTIGSLLGVWIGLATATLKLARTALETFLLFLRGIPFIAIVPISLRLFGLGEEGKFFVVALASFGVCWIAIHTSISSTSSSVFWKARSLGLSSFSLIQKIIIPEYLDAIFGALRTSLSLGLVVVAVAELGGVLDRSSGRWWSEGLGYRLFRSLDESRDDRLIAGIMTFAITAAVLDRLFVVVWVIGEKCARHFRSAHVKKILRKISIQLSAVTTSAQEHRNGCSLAVTDLTAGYGKFEVFNNVSVRASQFETVSIIGSSGCGKSTILKAICHFDEVDFWFRGKIDLQHAAAETRVSRISYLPQRDSVFLNLMVWENATLDTSVASDRDLGRTFRLLQEFGISGMETKLAREISGGQLQRLAFASALAAKPDLLCLDEPFGALDAITRRLMQDFFLKHIRGNITSVMVTHDIEEALRLSDRIWCFDGGLLRSVSIDRGNMDQSTWEHSEKYQIARETLLEVLTKSARSN